jgi:hypothetical protein
MQVIQLFTAYAWLLSALIDNNIYYYLFFHCHF